MDSIRDNILRIRESLPEGVRLVAVSKFNPASAIEEAYAVGQRLFGESHAQELVPKATSLPKDIKWHFIGHLQTNKVKQVVPYAEVIESVDSLHLLKEIDKQAGKIGKRQKCFLEFHVATEESKSGFTLEEAGPMLTSVEFQELNNIEICGIMGMASQTDDMEQVSAEFRQLKSIFNTIKTKYFATSTAFCELSMGMTHDYPIAIKEGATLVRVGSGIFGERMYN